MYIETNTGTKALITASVMLCMLTEASAFADNWPQFRGAKSQGVSTETELPTRWSETKNVVWKVDLPGKGSSSPVIWGSKIFLTSFSGYGLRKEEPGEIADLVRHVICLDRDTGRILWKKDIPNRGKVHAFSKYLASFHGYASHTPVTDGKAIYCWFANSGAFAFDFNGNELWQKTPPELQRVSSYGSAASPVLYGNLLLINANVEGDVFIALDKRTGDEIWRREKISSYAVPVIADTSRGPEMVLVRNKLLAAYNPLTGNDLWQYPHEQPGYVISTPALHDGVVYSNNGAGSEIVAVRTGGRGDVSSTHHLWSHTGATNIPSIVYSNGNVYSYYGSILHCVRAGDGQLWYKERVPRLNHVFASLLAADGKIYITGRYGRSVIVKDGPEFEIVAENRIEGDGSSFNASPAVNNGKLFIRSQKILYCIGKGDSNR